MKLLSIIVAVIAVAAIGVGGTLAVFTDTETSTGNSFTAGTLNLVDTISGSMAGPTGKIAVTESGDGLIDKVVFGGTEGLKPGESGSITWTLNNTGSLPGTLTIGAIMTSVDNGQNQPETAAGDSSEPGELDLYMGVWLTKDGVDIVGSSANYGTWAALIAALNLQSSTLAPVGAPAATTVYVLSWSLALDLKGAGIDNLFGNGNDVQVNDNAVQSDTLNLDITFTLTQIL